MPELTYSGRHDLIEKLVENVNTWSHHELVEYVQDRYADQLDDDTDRELLDAYYNAFDQPFPGMSYNLDEVVAALEMLLDDSEHILDDDFDPFDGTCRNQGNGTLTVPIKGGRKAIIAVVFADED